MTDDDIVASWAPFAGIVGACALAVGLAVMVDRLGRRATVRAFGRDLDDVRTLEDMHR